VEGGKIKAQRPTREAGERVACWRCVGDTYRDYAWQVTVRDLSARRGPAEVARKLYEETEESQAQRQAQATTRRVENEPAAELHGRPTKRDRRMMKRFIGE